MQEIVDRTFEYARGWQGQGALAKYIPELKNADPRRLAVVVTDTDGNAYSAGDADARFTMQSTAKLIILALALQDAGFIEVFSRVGMEPTGDPFNSIVRLETVNANRPLNPMINAGAIAVMSCVGGRDAREKFGAILSFARKLTGNASLDYHEKTFQSEVRHGDRNRALAYMMRAAEVFDDEVEILLEAYFKACSLYINCREISFLGAVLANNGVCPGTQEKLIEPFHVKLIRSLMATCGMYDASGEFALRVGVPAKSGVGGGIVGAVPGKIGIGVYSPLLDAKGNSLCGIKAMEFLSTELALSIF